MKEGGEMYWVRGLCVCVCVWRQQVYKTLSSTTNKLHICDYALQLSTSQQFFFFFFIVFSYFLFYEFVQYIMNTYYYLISSLVLFDNDRFCWWILMIVVIYSTFIHCLFYSFNYSSILWFCFFLFLSVSQQKW